MQAHSAPADCVSRDVSDLWHSANRPSLIYMALLALRPTPVPANIRQRAPRAEPEPRCSQPQGFFTSALTAWPPLLPAIITGFLWAGLKNCFLPVSRLLCCEQWTWYLGQTTSIHPLGRYIYGLLSNVHAWVFWERLLCSVYRRLMTHNSAHCWALPWLKSHGTYFWRPPEWQRDPWTLTFTQHDLHSLIMETGRY